MLELDSETTRSTHLPVHHTSSCAPHFLCTTHLPVPHTSSSAPYIFQCTTHIAAHHTHCRTEISVLSNGYVCVLTRSQVQTWAMTFVLSQVHLFWDLSLLQLRTSYPELWSQKEVSCSVRDWVHQGWSKVQWSRSYNFKPTYCRRWTEMSSPPTSLDSVRVMDTEMTYLLWLCET